jgi:hypothetical protein
MKKQQFGMDGGFLTIKPLKHRGKEGTEELILCSLLLGKIGTILRLLRSSVFQGVALIFQPKRIITAMSQVNPAGAAILGLIETLIDLVKNPDASRIEVAMASYHLDAQGLKIREGGKHSIALRSFEVKDMNSDTQEQLRQ